MFAVQREDVLNLMKRMGPIVPVELRKKLKADTFLIGAVLSELASRGLVKLTNLKKGSSPFYYLPGQENLIETLIPFLNEKDQRTANWLKEVKVIPDKNLDLLKRVSLRKITDFAKPLKAIDSNGMEVLFWRYYSYPEEDAIDFLKNGPKKEENSEQPLVQEENSEEPQIEHIVHRKESQPEPIQTKLVQEEKFVENVLDQKPINQKIKESISKDLQKPHSEIPEPSFSQTAFYKKVIDFFKEKEISVIRQDEISKKEYEFLIKVPSNIGKIVMLARAKDKKKLNESDVAPALLASKMIDVSCLFLITGEFTKKSLKEIDKLYTGLIVSHLN